MIRHCSTCQQTKPITAFHRDASVPTGRRWRCATCEQAKRARGPRQPDPARDVVSLANAHSAKPCRCTNPAISEDYDGERACVLCGRFETVARMAA